MNLKFGINLGTNSSDRAFVKIAKMQHQRATCRAIYTKTQKNLNSYQGLPESLFD